MLVRRRWIRGVKLKRDNRQREAGCNCLQLRSYRILTARSDLFHPQFDGELHFHGAAGGATPEDFRKAFADPDWKGQPGVEALADTALNIESSHELARIDVKGNYAVAVSRIEWARNDTTKNVRLSGGWESLWFLRKIDGNWKFTSAVGGISTWNNEEPR